MSRPSVLVTGGNDGIGRMIVEYFAPDSMGVSRRNGYDVNDPKDRQRLVELSLQFDIFVNHAHTGHFVGQTRLLLDLFHAWEAKKKSGYIFNTSSYSTYCGSKNFQRYAVIKYGLDMASRQCSKKIENGHCEFRVTNIKPGILDQENSRQKSHWQGWGVSGTDYAQLIESLYNLPAQMAVPEIVLSTVQRDVFRAKPTPTADLSLTL